MSERCQGLADCRTGRALSAAMSAEGAEPTQRGVPSPLVTSRDRVCNNIEMTGFYHTILKCPELGPDMYLPE